MRCDGRMRNPKNGLKSRSAAPAARVFGRVFANPGFSHDSARLVACHASSSSNPVKKDTDMMDNGSI